MSNNSKNLKFNSPNYEHNKYINDKDINNQYLEYNFDSFLKFNMSNDFLKNIKKKNYIKFNNKNINEYISEDKILLQVNKDLPRSYIIYYDNEIIFPKTNNIDNNMNFIIKFFKNNYDYRDYLKIILILNQSLFEYMTTIFTLYFNKKFEQLEGHITALYSSNYIQNNIYKFNNN
jgi:hypothetical protein